MTTFGFSFPSAIVASMDASRWPGSMLYVRASMSMKTGVAPVQGTISAVAQKVKEGTKTASPAPTPHAFSGRTRASVPLPQPSACFAPPNAARACSNSRTGGPMT